MGLELNRHRLASVVIGVVLSAGALLAQTPPQKGTPDKPTFSVQVDLVSTDVIVRDDRGQFVPDLKKDEFQVFEDGIRQDIATMTLVHGGRVTNLLTLPPPPAVEGVVLPPTRPTVDISGRIFLFFVDDLHMDVHNTARTRDLFKQIQKTLLHDGDMWAMLSSGPSSLHIDLTYDRRRFDDAVNRITGNGLPPSEIIQTKSGADGPAEVRYRTQVAFSSVKDALANLEKVHNRRKAFVYVSEGYDLIPFQKSRSCDPSQFAGSSFQQNDVACLQNMIGQQAAGANGNDQQGQVGSTANLASMGEEFADAELSRQLIELTKDANRANATFYTIDPRGLVALGDIGQNVDPREWNMYVRKAQTTLRVLAEETGGVAVVNTNDFDKGLKRIDAETSDYYVLGFYAKNPDPMKRSRKIEVKVARTGVSVWSRKEYALRLPTKPAASQQP